MRVPQLSLNSAMLWLIPVAVNLSVYKVISGRWNSTELGIALALSTWLMGNLLAFVGYRRVIARGMKGPYSTGFLIGGTGGLVAQVGWILASPQRRDYAIRWTSEHFVAFCIDHVPGAYVRASDGVEYYQYQPLMYLFMSIVFSVPSLISALIGVVCVSLMFRHDRPKESQGVRRAKGSD